MTPEEIERGKRYAAAFTADSGAAFADRPTVRYVQHSLNQLGFNAGSVDGLMGPRTRNAIQAYLTSIGDSGGSATVTPPLLQQIGRASCRGRVCRSVESRVASESYRKKKKQKKKN